MKPSFTGGQGQVSFESVNFVNLYISADKDMNLKLKHVANDYDSKGIASFSVEYLPCNSRRHLLRGDGESRHLISVW